MVAGPEDQFWSSPNLNPIYMINMECYACNNGLILYFAENNRQNDVLLKFSFTGRR